MYQELHIFKSIEEREDVEIMNIIFGYGSKNRDEWDFFI